MTVIDPAFHFTADDIAEIELPARTKSYVPVGHRDLRDEVVSRFANAGRYVDHEGYHMRKEGSILLGMIVFKPQNEVEEIKPLTALVRNSYGKTHSAGVAIGPSVSYCLNMCIGGSDVTFLRKHTKNVWRDLRVILDEAVSTAEERYQNRLEEIGRMEQLRLSDTSGYEILGHLAGVDILKPRMFSSAMKEWKEPRFEAFKERNAWSLYNAVTWGIKSGSPEHVVSKNPAAHEFFSALVAD